MAGRLGEFELIRRYFDRGPARGVELGIGDDCALIRPAPGTSLAVSTDMLVAGRHFFDDVDPAALGHKALAVNLSDLAAMGARPLAFTLAIALPEPDEAWLAAFSAGLFAIADRFGCELIGGDTSRGPLNVCITVFGELPQGAALRRDHAQPGDDLWVSGELGGAAFAVRCRQRGERASEAAQHRLDLPAPRVALGEGLRHLARAAIDLSDGLSGDLAHICERSRVGARVDWPLVPVAEDLLTLPEAERATLALAGGDDYELLFTAAPENRAAIERLGLALGVRLTRIGGIDAGQDVALLDARGRPLVLQGQAHDHFR